MILTVITHFMSINPDYSWKPSDCCFFCGVAPTIINPNRFIEYFDFFKAVICNSCGKDLLTAIYLFELSHE